MPECALNRSKRPRKPDRIAVQLLFTKLVSSPLSGEIILPRGQTYLARGSAFSSTGRPQDPGHIWKPRSPWIHPDWSWTGSILYPVQHTPSSCRGFAPLWGRLTHGLGPPRDPICPPKHFNVRPGDDSLQLYPWEKLGVGAPPLLVVIVVDVDPHQLGVHLPEQLSLEGLGVDVGRRSRRDPDNGDPKRSPRSTMVWWLKN